MMRELREFDWQRFWLQEVVILSVPLLFLVMTSRAVPPLNEPRLVILLVFIVGMTMFNVIQNRVGRVRR